MEKFNDALASLDSIQKNFDIYVPSINRKVKFKGLTTKQQKDAVKTALEKAFSGISFALLANAVIKANSAENIDFLVTDRSYILTALRIHSLGTAYKKDEKEIDLSPLLDINIPLADELKTKTITDGSTTIHVSIPTLIKDSYINAQIHKNIAILPDDEKRIQAAVGEIYINELAKYIDKVEIVTEKGVVDILFKDITLEQKIQVVERIPLSINTQIIDFINKVRAAERKNFEYNGQQIEVDIDPSLFTV